MQKTKEDPVKLQSYRARQRAKRKKWAAAYTSRRLQAFKDWFNRNKADLDTFTWNRWRSVFLTESVDKTCAACGMRSRRGLRRLWFIRKSDPELWDCTSCFVSSDLSETVPIEGAERFYNGVYLQPEPTATEGTVDHKDTHEVVDRIDGNDHV